MPSKQEEIREGLQKLFDEYDTEGDLISLLLNYLHSQGVVIKVDRELPNPELFEDALSNAWRRGGKKQGIDVSEEADRIKLFLKSAGCVATEPLVEE